MSSKTAGLMRWHAEDRNKDGVLRHPTDIEAWATLDNRYSNFAEEIQNVKLGLSSDGFNPFGIMSSVHSTWLMVLMPYNLPLWYLKTLKSYVRNRSCPEGSLAEGYVAKECLNFCSRYLHDVESKLNRVLRNTDDQGIRLYKGLSIFSRPGWPIGSEEFVPMLTDVLVHMHSYMLFNCPEVAPYTE
ncbi:hypothetical protein L1049_019222 [Liquidambar formosana]|uniref:DUF4218 domain-containing protein n=1 Tax=Liquidambar formosana TaxID=63359 RepID=A0AAP0RD73_LIQFO